MFARVMGIVSPSVFLASSIVWGLSTGNLIAGVLSVALGIAAAFMSFRAWRKTTGGIAERLTVVERQEEVLEVRRFYRRALLLEPGAGVRAEGRLSLWRVGCSDGVVHCRWSGVQFVG